MASSRPRNVATIVRRLAKSEVAVARRVGVLTGLAMEARCLRGTGLLVACSGARPERGRAEVRRLLDEGVVGLVSFGLAGGLDPALRPGALVLADAVVLPDGRRLRVDAAWRARLAEALGAGHLPPRPLGSAPEGRLSPTRGEGISVAGSGRLLVTAEEKRALREESGAVAVDMESHIVAEAAATAGLPFVVVRAISDPAGRALPPAALALVHPEGGIRLRALGKLLARPRELGGLVRLGLETRAALKALRRAAPLLGRLG
jgi:adenosylhomocysteine nucleosidase